MSYTDYGLTVIQCYKRVERRVLGECEAAWCEAVGRAVHARSQQGHDAYICTHHFISTAR
jgi:hypothetical protein